MNCMKKPMFADIDKENMYNVLKDFPKQIRDAYSLGRNIVPNSFKRLIITGMGGSALPGGILKSYLFNGNLPIYANKEYSVPEFVDENTLVIAVSYSGNTEETVSALDDALSKGAQVVVITSGGKLKERAEKEKIPVVLVPSGLQPRMAYAYLFFPILRVLENAGVVQGQGKEVDELVKVVSKSVFESEGKKLAKKLKGKIPLIYSSDRLEIASYKWKINFNENTKILAFSNVLPEMNHNEINGFWGAKESFFAIMLRDREDHKRVRKQMDISKGVIKKVGFSVEEINSVGDGSLARLFSLIVFGDWTSYFLCMEYKRDPSPVPVIEDLKKQLAK